MVEVTHTNQEHGITGESGFVRSLGLFDGVMIVVGSMIGSGIFIVAADIARETVTAECLVGRGAIQGVQGFLRVTAGLCSSVGFLEGCRSFFRD